MRALYVTAIATMASFGGCKEQNPDYCPAHPEDPRCGGTAGDAGVDAPDAEVNTTLDAMVCLGKDDFTVCFQQPTQPKSFADGVTVDTASDSNCLVTQPTGWEAAGQLPACFIVGTTVNVPNVNVVGSRPLVLVALNNLTVNGVLDVASHNAPVKVGPGAPSSACVATAEPGDFGTTKEAGGGGAGGSFFGNPGRNGGSGDNTAAAGGIAASSLSTAPVLLRAGCNGQSGGDGSTAGNAGGGGAGGGAVYLLAGGTLTIAGTGAINASGAGATGGGSKAGGGGGGSGGMIVLHANEIMAMTGARLIANGGGGGAGANNGGGTIGNDPPTTLPLMVAPGSSGCGNGCGSGGAGAAQGTPAQIGGDGGDQLGGGGGGGGLGYIRVNQTIGNVAASPTPDVIP